MPGTTFNTANWTGHAQATPASPGSALSNFTGLIDIANLVSEASDWASNVQSDGADIRLTKSDDTELAYDLIDWDYNGGSPTGFIRFLYSGSWNGDDVRVWAGYTGGTATPYDANETFGSDNAYDSNWAAYWPLHDLNDRTASGLTLTEVGSPTSGAAGQLGDCYELNGSSQYLKIDSLTDPVGAYPMTIMGWFRSDSITANQTIFSIGDTAGDDHWIRLAAMGGVSGDPVRTQVDSSGGDPTDVNSTTGFSESTWTHGAAVLTSSALDAYIDAGSNGNTAYGGAYPSGIDALAIGLLYRASPVHHFDGRIDDVQLHSAERSADWIAYEYSQSNDNATFWGAWSWTAGGGGGLNHPPTHSPIHHSPIFGR